MDKQKIVVTLFILTVCFLTIATNRGIESGLIPIVQSLADLFWFSLIVSVTFFFFILFALILYKFEDLKLRIYKKIDEMGNSEYLFIFKYFIFKYFFKFMVIVIYYFISFNILKAFLITEFGVTSGTLRYAIIASFTLLFLCRFFSKKESFKFGANGKFSIKEILLTIVFLGFLRTLILTFEPGEIPQLTSPEYETTNLLFLVPALDFILIEIWRLPNKIIPQLNKIFKSKK